MNRRERDGFDDLPILADLRELLADHVHTAGVQGVGAATRHRRPGGWALNGARRAGVALAVAVALAVVAVGLLALHQQTAGHHSSGPAGNVHHPSPPAGGPSPSAINGYVNTAQRQTVARDHACSPPSNRGRTIDHGAPPETMLSTLGVLRRPPLGPDPTNKVLYSIGWDAEAGVYVNYIRRARTEYGRSYWIVPEARVTPFGPIPARCYAEFRATLRHDLRHASPRLRRQTLETQKEELQADRQSSEHREGLCFIEIGLHVRPHPGAVGFGCSPGISGTVPPSGGNGSGDHAGGTIMSGMAHDGVVAVTVHYDAGGRDPAQTITSDVVNNVYVLRIPAHTAHQAFPSAWRLRLTDGRVVSGVRGGGG
jgi:hypothetical protein